MTDPLSKEKRTEIMKKVRSKGNRSTELRIIELFKIYKITGWRRNYKLFGHPDFVFPKAKIAVFADGCFWHGHNCRNTTPSNNYEYWREKIIRNRRRDDLVNAYLAAKGWLVIRIWECEIKKGAIDQIEFLRTTIEDTSESLANNIG